MWGPYSPKLYDGIWVQQHAFELTTKFKKDVIIADNHFSWARDHKEDVWPLFYCNYPEPKPCKNGDVESVLTTKKRKYNEAVR